MFGENVNFIFWNLCYDILDYQILLKKSLWTYVLIFGRSVVFWCNLCAYR